MHCPHCGQPNPPTSQFCAKCGTSLDTARAALMAPPAGRPSYPPPAPPIQFAAQPMPQQTNVYVQQGPPPPVMIVNQASGPGCLIRGLWFICIGLWLGGIVTLISWPLIASIIGLPIGLMLLNRLPKIMTLQPSKLHTQVTMQNGTYVVQQSNQPQRSFVMRAIYFVIIGWWLSGFWLGAAWAIAGFTFGLGLPLAFWMFNRVGAITTLAR